MPGDVRYAPYVNMAPHDPSLRPVGFRPHRFTAGVPYAQQPQSQQPHRHHSPLYYQGTRIPVGGHQLAPTTPGYSLDGRSNSTSRAWEYSSPGYSYFTPPASNGSMSQPVANPMVPVIPYSRYGPPRLPDRRIVPYGHPTRGFWVDQFASIDVNRREPLPLDWHPFVDTASDPPPSQPAVTGGVMAVPDYDLKVMAEFVANVSCNFINLAKPWGTLISFVERLLNQARLPSSTVILGLTYLAKRLATMEAPEYEGDPTAPLIPTAKLYEYLTISLILANKFLDDNTFTNTSWSDITGIPRHDLNVAEREWLKALGYALHLNPTEQKGWSTWRKAWETWQFDATGKGSPLLTPVLSRSNSSGSSRQGNTSSPATFPSTAVGKWTGSKSQNTAYLTPPISPTFDQSIDDFLSPVTPPSNYQWPPASTSVHPSQLAWRPLPNTRNVPMSAYVPVPTLQKFVPVQHSSHYWDLEKGCGSPWDDYSLAVVNSAHRPKWYGMAG